MKKLLIAFVVLATQAALAGKFEPRYMVVMKSKNDYKEVQTTLQKFEAAKNSPNNLLTKSLRSAKYGAFLATDSVQVEKSLDNVQAFIVKAKEARSAQLLGLLPGVEAVITEEILPAPKMPFNLMQRVLNQTGLFAEFPNAKTPWGILAVHAPQAWTTARHGSAARVLVLDTGIDKDHPALKSNFEKGKDFIGDHASPYEYADGVGHGTHVAGTIAAQMNPETGFVGVAPMAKILAGRVCSTEGCPVFAIVEGVNWGISENVDVISMSLGGPCGSIFENVQRKAMAAAEEKGIAIVAASGNDGMPKVGCPAAIDTVVAVGAVDSSIKRASFSQYGPELDVVAPGVDVLSSVPQGAGRESLVEIVVNGQNANVKSTSFDGAKSLPVPVVNELVYAGLGKPEEFTAAVEGKFALIKRGELTFIDKVQNAIKAKAAGVVLYNNVPGLIQGALTQDGKELPIPVVMIEQSVGDKIQARLSEGMVISAKVSTVTTDYSSYQGTSMATPHVSGIVALMKSANKKLTPAQIRAILKETANPIAGTANNEAGAGLVQADKAVEKALSLR